jgi:hypothetical protein
VHCTSALTVLSCLSISIERLCTSPPSPQPASYLPQANSAAKLPFCSLTWFPTETGSPQPSSCSLAPSCFTRSSRSDPAAKPSRSISSPGLRRRLCSHLGSYLREARYPAANAPRVRPRDVSVSRPILFLHADASILISRFIVLWFTR